MQKTMNLVDILMKAQVVMKKEGMRGTYNFLVENVPPELHLHILACFDEDGDLSTVKNQKVSFKSK